jgi:sugar phosphate isomerase/epimerase
MKLAISTCYDYSVPLDKSLEHIAVAGFGSISIGGRTDHSRYLKEDGRREIASLVNKHKLGIDSIHAPFEPTADLTQHEEVLRHSAVVEIKRSIAACKELGVRTLIVHLNSFRSDGLSERIKHLKESLAQVMDHAARHSVRIAAENLPGDHSLVLLKFALDSFGGQELGLCFDNGHAALQRDSMALLEAYRGRIHAIHLHDNDGKSDQHKLPFNGSFDFPNLAAQLNKTHLECPITIESETSNSPQKTPETFLPRALLAGTRFREMLKK